GSSSNLAAWRRTIIKEINFYLSLESGITLFISFLINCAILISFACIFPLHQNHNSNGKLPGLYEGAKVLETAIGPLGPLLWGCGLLAAGQTATVTVTLAGQQVLEGFWRYSVSAWRRIAGTRIASLVPALIVASVWPAHIDMLGEWFNVLQSICLPIALVPLLRLTSARSVMGEFRNPGWLRFLGWLLLTLIMLMNGVLYADLFDRYIGSTIIGYVLLSGAGLGILAYLVFCTYITICPLKLVDASIYNNE
ncbi:natural resistance-associated macrophage protein-domain-containing protein, partial [Syncephalis plumigaleata]